MSEEEKAGKKEISDKLLGQLLKGFLVKETAAQVQADTTVEVPTPVVEPPEHYGYPTATGNPFFHLSQFPSMACLHQNWTVIRDEALAARAETPVLKAARPPGAWYDAEEFEKFFKVVDQEEGWHRAPNAEGDKPNNEWLNYGLIFNGRPLSANAKRCPRTVALLEKLPIRVAGFSLILPETTLGQHRDATGLPFHSLAYHLGLDVPDGEPGCCRLTVNGMGADERNGLPLVFDSSYTHHAVNTTKQERIILYIDFCVTVHPNGMVHERSEAFKQVGREYEFKGLCEDDFSREARLAPEEKASEES